MKDSHRAPAAMHWGAGMQAAHEHTLSVSPAVMQSQPHCEKGHFKVQLQWESGISSLLTRLTCTPR